jgi:hypothetical protein
MCPVWIWSYLTNALTQYHNTLVDGLPGTLLNYPGGANKVDRRQFAKGLDKGLNDFDIDKGQKEKYVHHFLWIQDQLASSRILRILENL